jgi:hypothetical protein
MENRKIVRQSLINVIGRTMPAYEFTRKIDGLDDKLVRELKSQGIERESEGYLKIEDILVEMMTEFMDESFETGFKQAVKLMAS